MLAVTTRNRLHSTRFCLPMLRARALIARQLAETRGLVRYASGIASPTEFLTLTVWEDKAAMRAFMQSGAHERFMWLFSRWTKSFWGMRWEPGEDEFGAWDGVRLASRAQPDRTVSPLVAVGLLPAESPRAGPTGPRSEPGPVEPRTCGLFAATAIVDGPRALLGAAGVRRRLRAESATNDDLVRWTAGFDLPARALLVTLWRDAARARALDLLGRELGADWAIRWDPGDYEIGHWEGFRLRQAARRQAHTAYPAYRISHRL
jgi:hypothetical protein